MSDESETDDMNVRMRRGRAPHASRTERWDDPDASSKINADIRAAFGRGIVEDDTDDADDAA